MVVREKGLRSRGNKTNIAETHATVLDTHGVTVFSVSSDITFLDNLTIPFS